MIVLAVPGIFNKIPLVFKSAIFSILFTLNLRDNSNICKSIVFQALTQSRI